MLGPMYERRSEAGEVPLSMVDGFVDTADALVELDNCVCDFVVQRHSGTVMLRQRSGEFANGKRLVRKQRDAFGQEIPEEEIDINTLKQLNIFEEMPDEVAKASDPARGSWEEKLKNGLVAGVTQCLSTMFCYGLQHAIADSVLEGIVEHWTDLEEPDLIENSADTAVRIAHIAAGHFIGIFHLSAYRQFSPWLNRCLEAGSFKPLDPKTAKEVEKLDLEIDQKLFSEALCAYAVHEQITMLATEEKLLVLAGNVLGWSAAYLNSLIMQTVQSAVSHDEVMNEKNFQYRLDKLGKVYTALLNEFTADDSMPAADIVVGPMMADIGGLLFDCFADEELKSTRDQNDEENFVVGVELLLAVWFHAVKSALNS